VNTYKNKIKKIYSLISFFCLFILLTNTAFARIIFESEFLLENSGSTWIIDSQDDVTGDVTLQFGNTLAKTLTYDTVNSWFEFNDDMNLNQNELKNFVIDNLAAAPAAPVEGQIYHNTADNNTYVYNGTGWEDIAAISSTSTKVVTVGTGLDYADIASAATYLNTLSGGIMILSAETHSVSTSIDMSNISVIGKGSSKTAVAFTGAGQLEIFDTKFADLTLDVNAITDDMALDVANGASSVQFEWVSINIQDAGDSLIDSNQGVAPSIDATFNSCEDTGGSGTILKTQAVGNLDGASELLISSASGTGLLYMDDWDVTIAGSGNVYTTGVISSIPSNTIFVYPGMNLQGAIDSLTSGGTITLLPGNHSISEPLDILNDNIIIEGYGDSSVIVASGFGATGDTVGALIVGAANGSAAVDGVVLRDFKLNVGSNIHGIRIVGGQDNKVFNVTVQKTAGTSGSGASADIGIQAIDASGEALIRPVIKDSRVFGGGAAIYFTDGIHVSSDGSLSGVWGYGNGVQNALVDGNNVDYIRESGLVFIGVDNSSLFNNRVSSMGVSGGYGIYMGGLSNVNMNANVFTGSLTNTSIAIGVDAFGGAASSTIDSIFNNNIIDGTANGGVGFATGFEIGGAAPQVLRNSFQSNTIKGASAAGSPVAIDVSGDTDYNTFSNNDIYGGVNTWTTGIDLTAATQNFNLIRGNRFVNVTTNIQDLGTDTKMGVAEHSEGGDPGVNDDIASGYGVGTIWVNTTNDESFISVDSTAGAAVWKSVGGATTNKDIILDINGGIRTSASIGSVGGGRSPVIRFDAGDNSRARWSFPVSSDWDGSSDFTVTVYWTPSDNGNGDVDFDLDYASFSVGDTIASGSFTDVIAGATYQTVNVNTDLDLYSFTATIPAAALTVSDMIDMRLSRTPGDAGDTYASDVNIHMVKVSYTVL